MRGQELVLKPEKISRAGSAPNVIAAMLEHVRRVAPGLNVPVSIPRIETYSLEDSGGQFVERDGYVFVRVRGDFFAQFEPACSILAHEVCHYVLSVNRIRAADETENEQLTDTAMFVLGLGDVFLSGYRGAVAANRPGHRLGYLSDSDYRDLDDYVFDLHVSAEKLPARSAVLEKKLATLVPDAAARQRLIAWGRRQCPGSTEEEVLQATIDRVLTDRR